YVRYSNAFSSAPIVERSIAVGLHLQPFFLARFARNLENGPAHLDLTIDSFAFDVGAFWAEPRGASLARVPGIEIALGFAVPILPNVSGPLVGLRGALRWPSEDLASARDSDVLDRGAMLSVTLGWRQVLPAHLVDPGDRALR